MRPQLRRPGPWAAAALTCACGAARDAGLRRRRAVRAAAARQLGGTVSTRRCLPPCLLPILQGWVGGVPAASFRLNVYFGLLSRQHASTGGKITTRRQTRERRGQEQNTKPTIQYYHTR